MDVYIATIWKVDHRVVLADKPPGHPYVLANKLSSDIEETDKDVSVYWTTPSGERRLIETVNK